MQLPPNGLLLGQEKRERVLRVRVRVCVRVRESGAERRLTEGYGRLTFSSFIHYFVLFIKKKKKIQNFYPTIASFWCPVTSLHKKISPPAGVQFLLQPEALKVAQGVCSGETLFWMHADV